MDHLVTKWFIFDHNLSEREYIEDVGANAWKYNNLIQLIAQASTLTEKSPTKSLVGKIQWERLNQEQNEINDELENIRDIYPSKSQLIQQQIVVSDISDIRPNIFHQSYIDDEISKK